MNAYEIRMRPEERLLPPVVAAVRAYAENYFTEKKDLDRIALSVEEAIGNVLRYSMDGRLEEITVTADAEGGEFTVCVLDKGLPGDYEKTLQGEDRLGLTLMQNAMDVVRVENLGFEGRRQTLVKYYSKLPDLQSGAGDEADTVIENAEITVRSPRRDEALAVSRLFYQEYGFRYINETVYYPERYYAAVAKDQLHTTVAVDQHGNIAGHHGVAEWSDVPGVWESGMAIVSKRYRNAGIFGKMMDRTYRYVRDEAKGKLFVGCCVTMHPYSQKMRLKLGSFPCGFNFNFAPADVFQNTFADGSPYNHEAIAATVFDFTEKAVWLDPEIAQIAQFIYDGLKLPRTVCTEAIPPEAESSESI